MRMKTGKAGRERKEGERMGSLRACNVKVKKGCGGLFKARVLIIGGTEGRFSFLEKNGGPHRRDAIAAPVVVQ